MSELKITEMMESRESAEQVYVQKLIKTQLFEKSSIYEEGLGKIDCLLRVLRDYSFEVLNRSEIKASAVESIYVMAEDLKNLTERTLEGKRIW